MFLGGFTYKNQNSPPSGRRSIWGNACSPFRNSDMSRPLEDILNITPPIGPGSNGNSQEKASPSSRQIIGVGRTFKDYEDQLDGLKRDNFNLKLRIYFLEEKMGSSAPDQNAIRDSIELKVEVESLRKELAEKQELLSQAAKAFELIDEQKKMLSKEQSVYQKTLDEERDKIKRLEHEIEEYKEKMADCSMYYTETFGITPEAAIENEKKMHQLEELVSSLEAEVKQLTHSLEEERSWNQELEKERDDFRERIEIETLTRNKLTSERNAEIERLHEQMRELEEIILRKDSSVQQYRNELIEKERMLKEKCGQLEEKIKMCDELYAVSEKRKKQIDSLRMSLKTKDDSFTDLSNKHRLLVSQLENSYTRRNTPPNSPSTMPSLDSSPRLCRSRLSPTKNVNEVFNWEVPENYMRSPSTMKNISKEYPQELEDKDRDTKKMEEINQHLLIKVSTLEKTCEQKDKELELQKEGYQRALESIRELMDRYHTLEKSYRELAKINVPRKHDRGNRSSSGNSGGSPLSRRNYRDLNENPERDHDSNKRRFDEMESKIDDLRTEIETIKAEKVKLEEQIQTEAEELQEKLLTREQKIELLEHERDEIREELLGKISELNKLKENCQRVPLSPSKDRTALQQVITNMNQELDEKNHTIEQLSKELQVKTQNLQKLVNTELWSKNKEIAKLHNHMSTSQCSDRCHDGVQLANLIRELNDIGINVKITEDVIQLNYVNGNGEVDVKTMTEYIQKLTVQKKKLENEVDYLKWLKLVSKPDIVGELDVEPENEKVQKYCDLLRAHLKELMKFMKNLLRSDNLYDADQHKNILEVLKKSQFISQDFVQTMLNEPTEESFNSSLAVRKSRSENTIELLKSRVSTPSDSEVFSEPDRNVSMARIGLQEQQPAKRESPRSKSKFSRVASDSEDSEDYSSQYKVSELNEDANVQLQGLKRMLNFLYTQLISFRNDCNNQVLINVDDDRFTVLIEKTKQSQKMCENLQSILDKKMYDSRSLKKFSKQHSLKKSQLEKKLADVENMALEISKQKSELVEYKENLDRRTSELLIGVNRENESLKAKVKKLEDDIIAYKSNLSSLTKDLDQLTISHSHTLVENSKLTNEKLKLEHELRKSENLYDTTVRSLQQKCNKEINDLNNIIDSHHDRMQELEVTNKELRRQVVACEASDSAPSSSGVSSMIPVESLSRPGFDDIVPELQNANGCYWWQMAAPTTSTRSKSSCSPDLGIESDGTAASTRPLQERPKVSGSMTNLLSDTEQRLQDDVDNESPLPNEGYEDIEALRQENEALKLRLLKTRKALEDTFRNLMTSNKNKKNVEKAITRHLVMTEDIWKKTKSYEQTFENC